MRKRGAFASLAAVAAAGLMIGCGSGDADEQAGIDAAQSGAPTTVDLNPTTTEVAPLPGAMGQEFFVGGVAAEVVDVQAYVQSQLNGAQVIVEMRSDNRSPHVQRNPDVTLRCSDRDGVGDWAGGSTWEPNALLPMNATMSGVVVLAFPFAGPNAEYRSVTCADPRIGVRFTVVGEEDVLYEVPFDPSVIDAALRAPTGPLQPLPYDAG